MTSGPSPPDVAAGPPTSATVELFDGPSVVLDGVRHRVPEGSQRVLAFVALRAGRVRRRVTAGTLWPIGDDVRAAGNLRSALWRLRGAGIGIIDSDKWSLGLAQGVAVDVHRVGAWAERIVLGHATDADLGLPHRWTDALDLLPGWDDDWTLLERERLRQRMLHGLEALSRLLTARGRHAEAVDAAITAVTAEPLRESAQRTLIEAHLAEANWVEARRTFLAFEVLIGRELGVAPSAELAALVRHAAPRSGRPVLAPVAAGG
jgi:DNA-binding SARP family transcriptional activator